MAQINSRWKVVSKTDPRFNLEGRGDDIHALELPPDARSGIKILAQELGVDPPEDLEYVREKVSEPPPPPPGVTYMTNPAEFLVESGLLFELNRRILHPLGLALAVRLADEPGADTDSTVAMIWDNRSDPEGIVFADETFAEGLTKLAKYMKNTGTHQLVTRRACLGYRIQGEVD